MALFRFLAFALALLAALAPLAPPAAGDADDPACAEGDACGTAAIRCMIATPASLHSCREDDPTAPGHDTFRVPTDGGVVRIVVSWTANDEDSEVLALRVTDTRDAGRQVIGRSPLVVDLPDQRPGRIHGELLPCTSLLHDACDAGGRLVRTVRDQTYAYALEHRAP